MIRNTAVVSETSHVYFERELLALVEMWQDSGLRVEIQYQTRNSVEGYTALVVGYDE